MIHLSMQEVCVKAVSGKKQVQFLTKWLSDLVRHEPAYALKVTIAG